MKKRLALVASMLLLCVLTTTLHATIIWGNREGAEEIWELCVGDLPIDSQEELNECACDAFGLYWYEDECHEEAGGGE